MNIKDINIFDIYFDDLNLEYVYVTWKTFKTIRYQFARKMPPPYDNEIIPYGAVIFTESAFKNWRKQWIYR